MLPPSGWKLVELAGRLITHHRLVYTPGIPEELLKIVRCASALLYVAAFGGLLNAQGSAKVDFQRDVQPILKANCIGCHGPAQQMNNYRLDRRRDAMRGGTIVVIAP